MTKYKDVNEALRHYLDDLLNTYAHYNKLREVTEQKARRSLSEDMLRLINRYDAYATLAKCYIKKLAEDLGIELNYRLVEHYDSSENIECSYTIIEVKNK